MGLTSVTPTMSIGFAATCFTTEDSMSKRWAGTQSGSRRNAESACLKISRCWLHRSVRSALRSHCHVRSCAPCWLIMLCETVVRLSRRQGRYCVSPARDIRLRFTRAMKLQQWILQVQWRLIGSSSMPPVPRARLVSRPLWHRPSP